MKKLLLALSVVSAGSLQAAELPSIETNFDVLQQLQLPAAPAAPINAPAAAPVQAAPSAPVYKPTMPQDVESDMEFSPLQSAEPVTAPAPAAPAVLAPQPRVAPSATPRYVSPKTKAEREAELYPEKAEALKKLKSSKKKRTKKKAAPVPVVKEETLAPEPVEEKVEEKIVPAKPAAPAKAAAPVAPAEPAPAPAAEEPTPMIPELKSAPEAAEAPEAAPAPDALPDVALPEPAPAPAPQPESKKPGIMDKIRSLIGMKPKDEKPSEMPAPIAVPDAAAPLPVTEVPAVPATTPEAAPALPPVPPVADDLAPHKQEEKPAETVPLPSVPLQLPLPDAPPAAKKDEQVKDMLPEKLPPLEIPQAKQEIIATIDFSPGEETVDALETEKVEAAAAKLLKNSEQRYSLISYAGAQGPETGDARRTALKRALAVRKILMKNGVDASRINVQAMGDKAKDDRKDRVDITLVN